MCQPVVFVSHGLVWPVNVLFSIGGNAFYLNAPSYENKPEKFDVFLTVHHSINLF
jgi:hypothetical protein